MTAQGRDRGAGTDDRHWSASCRTGHHDPTVTARPIVMEYLLVLALVILVGALALAEVTGVLDTLVHSISFVV